MARFASWLRHNSEAELVAAAQEDLARKYLDREGPLRADETRAGSELFWRGFFVPVYRRLPWRLRHRVLKAMPGSHRRKWRTKSPS